MNDSDKTFGLLPWSQSGRGHEGLDWPVTLANRSEPGWRGNYRLTLNTRTFCRHGSTIHCVKHLYEINSFAPDWDSNLELQCLHPVFDSINANRIRDSITTCNDATMEFACMLGNTIGHYGTTWFWLLPLKLTGTRKGVLLWETHAKENGVRPCTRFPSFRHENVFISSKIQSDFAFVSISIMIKI